MVSSAITITLERHVMTTLQEPRLGTASHTERLPMAALLALFAAGLITTLTEALPAGVLPQMSEALAVSEAATGQTVTVYAIGSFLTAIPVALATAGWSRRNLLLIALIGFLLANLVTAISLDFTVTMIARFIAGASSGVTWGLIAGYSQRLVGPALKGRAMAIAMAGTPVALSLGIPVGTFAGQAIGWQYTFGVVTLVTALLIVWTLWKLPNFPGQAADNRSPIGHVLSLKGLKTVLLIVGIYVLAHTILYTYISPLMVHVGMGDQVQWVLLDFGILSLVSIWLTGVLIDHHHRRLTIMATGLFALAAIALTIFSSSPVVDYVAIGAWGLAFGGAATIFQAAAINASGDHADMAQSLLVTMWNIGIAGGGLVGGILLAGLGVESLLIAVVILIVPATIIVIVARKHAFPAVPVK